MPRPVWCRGATGCFRCSARRGSMAFLRSLVTWSGGAGGWSGAGCTKFVAGRRGGLYFRAGSRYNFITVGAVSAGFGGSQMFSKIALVRAVASNVLSQGHAVRGRSLRYAASLVLDPPSCVPGMSSALFAAVAAGSAPAGCHFDALASDSQAVYCYLRYGSQFG